MHRLHARGAAVWAYAQLGAQASIQAASQADQTDKANLERRVDVEIQRVEEQARCDLAAMREESKHALDRETRMLRDMRAHALAEVDRLKGELKDCRQNLEDILQQHRELQRRTDVDSTALAAELRAKAADADRAQVCSCCATMISSLDATCSVLCHGLIANPLSRAQVMVAEKDAQLRHCEHQNDMLHDKVRVLTDSVYSLEAERTRMVSDLQASLSTACEKGSHHTDTDTRSHGSIAALHGNPNLGDRQGAPASMVHAMSTRRSASPSLAMPARCVDLENGTLAGMEHGLDATKRGASDPPCRSSSGLLRQPYAQ